MTDRNPTPSQDRCSKCGVAPGEQHVGHPTYCQTAPGAYVPGQECTLREQIWSAVYDAIRGYGGSLRHLAHQGTDVVADRIHALYADKLEALERERDNAWRRLEAAEQAAAKWRSAWEHLTYALNAENERAERLEKALREAVDWMDAGAMFLRWSEKMHPDGVYHYDQAREEGRRALAPAPAAKP